MATRYGRWETIGTLDQGGQAHVFLVKDASKELAGQFALKRLRNAERIDLFEREIGAVRKIQHPNMLRVVDYDLQGKKPYYVAEYCEGGSLEKIGAATYRGNLRKTVEVLLPIISAIEAAHAAGVVHRDVKPANILFRATGEPVLGDFGICHVEGDQRITRTDEAMGSRDYIAPEMEAGRREPVTGAVDVYALGKVMYWMVSGGKPFAREDHRSDTLYLPRILGEQRFEHVHARLDVMIATDYTKRLPIQLLPTQLLETMYLVEGNFAPLRPSLGLQCRWCGKGTYRLHQRVNGRGFIDWIGGPGLRALQCSYCGRLEVFDVQQVENATWLEARPDETVRGVLAAAELAARAVGAPRVWPIPRLQMFGLEWDIERNFLDWWRVGHTPDEGVIALIVLGPFCTGTFEGRPCGRRVVREARDLAMGGKVQQLESPCGKCRHRVEGDVLRMRVGTMKTEVFNEAARLHRNDQLVPGWT